LDHLNVTSITTFENVVYYYIKSSTGIISLIIKQPDGNMLYIIALIIYSFDDYAQKLNWTTEQIAIWKLQYA
jgi:hypothetical protein